MKIGQKVIFTEEVLFYPHTVVKKGETGIVIDTTKQTLFIKLDNLHKELEYWDNEITLATDTESKHVYAIKEIYYV